MYLFSRILYAAIVLFTGGGMAVGCFAKALQMTDRRAASKPWRRRLCNPEGLFWSAVGIAASISALVIYSMLIPEHHLKIVGLFPLAAAVLTLYKMTVPTSAAP